MHNFRLILLDFASIQDVSKWYPYIIALFFYLTLYHLFLVITVDTKILVHFLEIRSKLEISSHSYIILSV